MSEILVVLTNLPDEASAQTLAARLISARLAACVNILAPCRSMYRWQGEVEDTVEVPVLIKTTAARYTELEGVIISHHPDAVPEIIALPVRAGLPAYLDWVDAQTTRDVHR